MSVIAWDGTTLAADRQSTMADMRRVVRKIWRLKSGELAGITGNEGIGLELVKWYESGADPTKYPPMQATADWGRLTVITLTGAMDYEQRPWPIKYREKFAAWGSGRDYAIGAMAFGASAVQAVKIASRYNALCGLGIDTLRLKRR